MALLDFAWTFYRSVTPCARSYNKTQDQGAGICREVRPDWI